jgi:hypothetical protein
MSTDSGGSQFNAEDVRITLWVLLILFLGWLLISGGAT